MIGIIERFMNLYPDREYIKQLQADIEKAKGTRLGDHMLDNLAKLNSEAASLVEQAKKL